MKKVLFGLLVAMTAIGASTLTNAHSKNLALTSLWYQTADGTYSPAPPMGSTCDEPASSPCRLLFPNDVPTSTYPQITPENIDEVIQNYGTPEPQGDNFYYTL